eukprot:TRINITY_DN875_c0_g1_i1.p1 TRINITY_DN875_c0_g1~~TRINITY_DN875_c0_g1_i1.p1  ORF type:complete len:196 (+),score=55.41 TRINITY_DN875_c0_g1_i1:54-641(+)
MTPHPPKRDVTTTEKISDKDVLVTKVIRDHDELGKHTHTETVDRTCPMGETHTVVSDMEQGNETVHREVSDRVTKNGEVAHNEETVTENDQGVTRLVVNDTKKGNFHTRTVLSTIQSSGTSEENIVTTTDDKLVDGSEVKTEVIEQTRTTPNLTTTVIDETVTTTSKDGAISTATSHEEFSSNPSKKRKIEQARE